VPVLEKVGADEALGRVRGALGELATEARLNFEQVDVWCTPENLPVVAERLRDGDGIQCRFFTFLSAVDRSVLGEEGDQENPLEVLVHLYSPDYVIHVNIHVPLDPARPACPSIVPLFAGANWHERETHEMFGIHFEGHPALVNLYLPEDFDGHPLLKSFKLATRIVKQWPGAKDPDEASAGGR